MKARLILKIRNDNASSRKLFAYSARLVEIFADQCERNATFCIDERCVDTTRNADLFDDPSVGLVKQGITELDVGFVEYTCGSTLRLEDIQLVYSPSGDQDCTTIGCGNGNIDGASDPSCFDSARRLLEQFESVLAPPRSLLKLTVDKEREPLAAALPKSTENISSHRRLQDDCVKDGEDCSSKDAVCCSGEACLKGSSKICPAARVPEIPPPGSNNTNCTYDLFSPSTSKCGLVKSLPIKSPLFLDEDWECTTRIGKPEEITVSITGTVGNLDNTTNATCRWLNESGATFQDVDGVDSSNVECNNDTLTVVQGNVSHLLFSAYLL